MAETRRPTITGAPHGYNTRLAARGYGSRLVRTSGISYGVAIGTQEDEAANAKALYVLNRHTPTFALRVAFLSWSDREGFNRWMSEYMKRVATNQRVSGFMYVTCPARRFSRAGVPVGPLEYGDQIGQFFFPLTISFVGASGAVSGVGTTGVNGTSYYKPPVKDKTAAAFYPAGTQKAGAESLEGTFYDSTPPTGTTDEVGEVRPYDEQAARPGRPAPR